MIILRHQTENRLFNTVKGLLKLLRQAGIALLVVLIIFSCKPKERLPDGVLTKDEMVDLMMEFYLAEEKIGRLNLSRDSSEALFEILKHKILEKAAVEDSVFKRSFDYYVDKPVEMELIYTALVDSLQLKEQRAPQKK